MLELQQRDETKQLKKYAIKRINKRTMENKKQSVIGFMCTGAPDPSTFFLIFITNYARKFMQTERISVAFGCCCC